MTNEKLKNGPRITRIKHEFHELIKYNLKNFVLEAYPENQWFEGSPSWLIN
jgi:hypothetical protein